MRVIPLLIGFVIAACPAVVRGQSVEVQASGGAVVLDTGHNLSYGFEPGVHFTAGFGFRPTPRLAVVFEVERMHRASQLQADARGGVFGFRGGTLTVVSPQFRASLFRSDRVSPYGIVGFSVGTSRLSVSERFPEPVSNGVRGLLFGGGLSVPLGERISMFTDVRMIMGIEANELLGVAPVRAGVTWRF